MLIPSSEIVRFPQVQRSYFSIYKDLVTELCLYLRIHEGINISPFSSEEEEHALAQLFSSAPEAHQKLKVESFLNYYNHCFELSSRNISLRDKKESLRCFSYMYGLKIPCENEIYSLLEDHAFVEIYDLNFTQRYRSPDWLETTSYSLMAIETVDWRSLFFRSEAILATHMELIAAIYAGKINQPIYRPVEIHTVKELKSDNPLCAEIESLAYSPVFDDKGVFSGGLHVLQVHDLRSIKFSLCDDSPGRKDLEL